MLSTKFFRKGSQIIATIDVITSVLTFISIFFLVFLTITHGDRLEANVKRDQLEHPELAALFTLGRGPFVMIMLLFMFICVGYFYLARYLLHAANERSYTKIHRWCTVTLVIIVTRAAFFITAIFFTADRAFVSSFGIIGFLYQIFCLWFVRTFHDRLRIDNNGMIIKTKFTNELNQLESSRSNHHNNMNLLSMKPPDCFDQAHFSKSSQFNNLNTDQSINSHIDDVRGGGEKFPTDSNFSYEDEFHGQSRTHLDKKI